MNNLNQNVDSFYCGAFAGLFVGSLCILLMNKIAPNTIILNHILFSLFGLIILIYFGRKIRKTKLRRGKKK